MMKKYWGISKTDYSSHKKKTKNEKKSNEENEEEAKDTINVKLSSLITKSSSNNLYSSFNHIYFNDDITNETATELKKELRNIETQIKTLMLTHRAEKLPIYLHITTDGGLIHSAFSVIDCIKSLSVPVYTVVDGFVASAGTLISLAGEKRFMCKNAYMLIHELRSGVWGKMSEIEEECNNLKKMMTHITNYYKENTTISKKELDGILKKDTILNYKECINKGLVEEEYI